MPAKKVVIEGTWRAKTPEKPEKPEKPDKDDLKKIKLGVEIRCDVADEHAATLYLLGDSDNYRTISDVTANTGSNKDQYPYTCTVSISTTQQDKWLTRNMQDNATKWNKDHKLLDNAQDLSVTLYWNGTAWTIPDGVAVSTVPGYGAWHCLVIHTTHKPVAQVPKIVVEKTNDGLKLDENTGTLKVNYTVKVTNKSGFDLYGLRLTDVMDDPILTKVNAGDVGDPSVKLTFSNWKVGDKDAKLISGNENDLTHVLQLIDRDKLFEDEEDRKSVV